METCELKPHRTDHEGLNKGTQKGLSFEVYRKPTTADIIIPNDPCHPNEHKSAAIRYCRNRLDT